MHDSALPPLRYTIPVSAAQSLLDVPIAPRVDRAERISRALVLVDAGHSFRQAADQSGVPYLAVYRAAKRSDREMVDWEPEEGSDRRLAVKAAVTAEMGIERMMRDIDVVDPRYLAGWMLAAARLAGLVDVVRDERVVSGGNVLAQILDSLGEKGGRVRLAVERTGNRESPARLPLARNDQQLGPIGGEIAPLARAGDTHTHASDDGGET